MGGGDTWHQGFSAVDLARDFNYPELADYIRGKLPGISESAAAAPGTEKAHGFKHVSVLVYLPLSHYCADL